MLTRKHFQAFADEIAQIEDVRERTRTARRVRRVLAQFNPQFDAARFYVACGVRPDGSVPEWIAP